MYNVFFILAGCGCFCSLTKMSIVSFDKLPQVSKIWIALRRLDKKDEKVATLREVSIPPAADVTIIVQIVSSAFGLNCSSVVFKIRNHHGHLIPLNRSIPANSKHIPYVLEVAKIFQHVCPKLRTIPMTVINKTMKTRLQTIERRIQRLEDLLPQVKLRRNEKLTQEIECLNQKLRFLHQRMQVANSHTWKGVLIRAPLW
ncbi:uncharacterized protein si:zfos-1056e6.1 isoform X1 [Neolamprologus brichardi]|uniref:uncharacterized protein si:zfos-1056e6.1 isoform X1 n=1 Tax=Neolamprologus brichardi TaxID=32507 RepID=UPI0003EC66B5|nr:uncharacterized protein si:zfos-1056e6.1 isoform X1 [Neolamprologus brichardi]